MSTTDARGIREDFVIDRGERIVLRATITNKDTGNAVDLAGHTAEMIVESVLGGANVQKSTNTAHADSSNGITDFAITATTTFTASAVLPRTEWHYAVHWQSNDSPKKEDIHSYGFIYVNPVAAEAI